MEDKQPRLSECITRIAGKYVFNSKRFFADKKTTKETVKFYKKDVEVFLNNRKHLRICPGCGMIDSLENINKSAVHDENKCLKFHYYNFVYNRLSIHERWFPNFFSKNIRAVSKEGHDWALRRVVKDYSMLIKQHKKELIEDWCIKKCNLNYEICPEDFKVKIMSISTNV